ncbi:hypothetical protein [Paenibacillus sp. N3.4]|uniref:hypothetical protein n=1 Tax=Paenibacillus sp. N3.4 TaxID=2603222 RepID=UPI0011C9F0AE|nr:hypothetical protein [Paenibacillus sp. N3.4]TXK84351.1 hypothetical protein FU659_08940 [Paenibacillus sp. N3.4]
MLNGTRSMGSNKLVKWCCMLILILARARFGFSRWIKPLTTTINVDDNKIIDSIMKRFTLLVQRSTI